MTLSATTTAAVTMKNEENKTREKLSFWQIYQSNHGENLIAIRCTQTHTRKHRNHIMKEGEKRNTHKHLK